MAKSFCDYRYDHACGVNVVYPFSATKCEGATYPTAVHNVDPNKLQENGHCRIMLIVVDRHGSVELKTDDEDVGWGSKPLHMICMFWVEG